MMEDPKFWVSLSFLVFIALIAKPIFRFITDGLDARAGRIRLSLVEAERLREEAERLLASYQQKQQEAAHEAEAILAHARGEAERMTAQAHADLDASLEARSKAATEKISRAEAQALKDVQGHVVDLAVAASRMLLAQHGAKGSDDAVANAVAQLERKLH